VPEKVVDKNPDTPNTTYVYKDDVVLLVPLKVGPEVAPGTLTLKAKVSWLECAVQCVLGDAPVQATLNVGTETKMSKDAPVLEAWQKKLPRSGDGLPAKAWWEGAAKNDLRPVILEWNTSTPAKEADFYPDSSEQFEVQPITEKLPSEAGTVRLRAQVKKMSGDWPRKISGLLVQDSDKGQMAYDVSLPVGDTAASAGAPSSPAVAGIQPDKRSPWLMLLYAFLGGLILNVMPCVLPVIALKILGFVSDAKNDPGRLRKLGLIYMAGVLCSFLVLGLIAAALGEGWAFQFGNPYFLIGITTLVTLIALNLFGVFEVTLGSGALTTASNLASKHGASGAFFNGLLTTVLATSCSAPFLAAALGFASSLKNPLISLCFLLTVGLGLAAPYVVLSWQPAWLRFLPRPGHWMERFKVAMGFPMMAAAVWLCSLVRVFYGERAWWLAMFLIFVGVGAWVFGEFVQRGTKHRALAGLTAVLALLAGYGYALEKEMRWREPLKENATGAEAPRVAPVGVAWVKWSSGAVAAAQAEGRPVVVDFTATWCPTCNVIVKPSFENSAVQKKLAELKAVTLVADYSLRSSDIRQELKRFDRDAVPLVLIYPAKPGAAPMIFDLVSPSTILEALEQAAAR
jgi:thiol:disulfide interchange protein DsbD